VDSIEVSQDSFSITFSGLEIIIQDVPTTENIKCSEDEYEITQVIDRKVVYVDTGTVVAE
jgi:hypothetical protein